jgi:hypothetical protein
MSRVFSIGQLGVKMNIIIDHPRFSPRNLRLAGSPILSNVNSLSRAFHSQVHQTPFDYPFSIIEKSGFRGRWSAHEEIDAVGRMSGNGDHLVVRGLNSFFCPSKNKKKRKNVDS